MPDFHGVRTRLESQYDVKRIQEYTLPPCRSRSVFPIGSTGPLSPSVDVGAAEPDQAIDSMLIEAHVPTYPNSQFWLAYEVDSKVLASSQTSSVPMAADAKAARVKYVYFKLILPIDIDDSSPDSANGDKNRVISWGVGKKEGWKGKAMFGLFRTKEDWYGKGKVSKRGFWFSEDRYKEGAFDVQIFRARGRRRTHRIFPEMTGKTREGDEVELVNMGHPRDNHPQKYYQYALIDPLDKPFVTFRYNLRNLENLRASGIVPRSLLDSMETRYFEPTEEEAEILYSGRPTSTQTERDSASIYHSAEEGDENPDDSSSSYSSASNYDDDDNNNAVETLSHDLTQRLSIPPTIRLVPSTTFSEPHSPSKHAAAISSSSSTSLKPPAPTPSIPSFRFSVSNHDSDSQHFYDSTTEHDYTEITIADTSKLTPNDRNQSLNALGTWVPRTPTPVPTTASGARGTLDVPRKSHRRVQSGVLLRSALASALRRKGIGRSVSVDGVNMEGVKEGP